jgi:hypothetical protein
MLRALAVRVLIARCSILEAGIEIQFERLFEQLNQWMGLQLLGLAVHLKL